MGGGGSGDQLMSQLVGTVQILLKTGDKHQPDLPLGLKILNVLYCWRFITFAKK